MQLDVSYRNSLFAHYCLVVGLRTGSTVLDERRWCKPTGRSDDQDSVDVLLADRRHNPGPYDCEPLLVPLGPGVETYSTLARYSFDNG